MTDDSLMRRLRAARPVVAEPGQHDALFAQIVAEPGDPRLVQASPERSSRLAARKVRPWTRARSRLVAGSTLGLAGICAAFVLAVSGSAVPAAFAITRNGDGWVLLKINQLKSLPDANRRLTAMGIREQVTLYMAPGVAAVKGPVDCTPRPGARLSGPPLKVFVGTESIGPGRTAGVVGVSAYHLDHCVITGVSGPGNTGQHL